MTNLPGEEEAIAFTRGHERALLAIHSVVVDGNLLQRMDKIEATKNKVIGAILAVGFLASIGILGWIFGG